MTMINAFPLFLVLNWKVSQTTSIESRSSLLPINLAFKGSSNRREGIPRVVFLTLRRSPIQQDAYVLKKYRQMCKTNDII